MFGPPFLPVKCVLCGSELDNPRKRVKLKQELVLKLQEIVASEELDPEGYLCNDNCYKSVNKYFELKAALKCLKSDRTQKFKNMQGQSLRWKRELPSDVPVNENRSAKASRPMPDPMWKSSSLRPSGSYPVIPGIIRPALLLQTRPLQLTRAFPLYQVPLLPLSVASLNVASGTATTAPAYLNQDFQSEDAPVCKVEVRIFFFLACDKRYKDYEVTVPLPILVNRQESEQNCVTRLG